MNDNVKKKQWDLRTWVYFAIVMAFLIFVSRNWVSNHVPKIVYSESESLEQSIFIVRQADGNFKKGDYVSFRVPQNPFMGQVSVTKQILGVSGDTVEVKERVVYINGKEIGRAKPKTRAGQSLEVLEPLVIPDGRYFVAGTHIDSYDSRYKSFGLIAAWQIAGRAEPIF